MFYILYFTLTMFFIFSSAPYRPYSNPKTFKQSFLLPTFDLFQLKWKFAKGFRPLIVNVYRYNFFKHVFTWELLSNIICYGGNNNMALYIYWHKVRKIDLFYFCLLIIPRSISLVRSVNRYYTPVQGQV